MKKVLVIGAIIFCIVRCVNAQTTFQKAFIDTLVGFQTTSVLIDTDGYIIAAHGRTAALGTLFFRAGVYLLKTDFDGNILWEKVYAQPGKAITNGLYGSLQQTTGGYLVCGSIFDTITRNSDFFLCKINMAGDVVWLKPYGLSSRVETAFHGSKTSDGGYIMIGERFIQGNVSSSDYYVVRTDSLGNLIWQKTYGGSLNDIGANSYQIFNNNYIISGWSASNGPGTGGAWLLQIDNLGNVIWTKNFGTTGEDALGFASLSATGFFIWGGADTLVYNSETQYNGLIIKTDFNGDVQWRTFFNHQKRRIIHQVRELNDGSIIAIGEQKVGAADSTAAWIAKLNSSGDVLWERFYLNNFYQGPTYSKALSFNGDFQPTPDGGFIIAGALWKSSEALPNIFSPRVWLVKLDSNGCFDSDSCGLTVGVDEIAIDRENASVVVYPNPFSGQARVNVKADSREFANKEIEFQLFDVSGRMVQSQKHFLNQHGYIEFLFEKGQILSGIYFFKVIAQKNELGSGKLIIQ